MYQNYWCEKRGGISEYLLDDKSRVDCLLPDMAVEFDFARKRDELVGWAYLPNNNFLVQLLDKNCKFADIFVTKTGHSGLFNLTDFRP